MQWVHSALGKLRHAAPRAGAQISCDGGDHCLACGSDSCPILSHNPTQLGHSIQRPMACPPQLADRLHSWSFPWMEASESFAVTMAGPTRTNPPLLACACWERAMQIKTVCPPSSPGFPCRGSREPSHLQCSTQAASTGDGERSPADCAVFALYFKVGSPLMSAFAGAYSARRLRAACVISPEKCRFHVGRGTQAEKRFPRALFCCGEMLFGGWWVSTELFSPFPFSPTVGWSSGFWQGRHTWQAAALRETGRSVLGWGFEYVQKSLTLG